MKKTIYISGKISGLGIEEYTAIFDDAETELQYYGGFSIGNIVNPVKLKPFLGIKCWLCYMINCNRAQRKCTHTAMISNWTDSRGAVIEYFFAKFIFKQDIIWL